MEAVVTEAHNLYGVYNMQRQKSQTLLTHSLFLTFSFGEKTAKKNYIGSDQILIALWLRNSSGSRNRSTSKYNSSSSNIFF